MRGFNVANGYQKIKLPERKTKASAGYDFYVATPITIEPGDKALVETGVKAYMANDEVLKIYLRSSVAKNQSLQMPNHVGIIDADYYENPENDGAIFILVHNYGNTPIHLEKNSRIAQGIFQKYLISDQEIKPSRPRAGGFGST